MLMAKCDEKRVFSVEEDENLPLMYKIDNFVWYNGHQHLFKSALGDGLIKVGGS